jgi:hypothetical protein
MTPRTSLVLSTVLAVATAAPPAVTAQGSFEGVVTMQVATGPEGQQTVQYSIKGNNARLDMSTQGMEMYELYDGTTRIMDMVIPMRRMYMEHTYEKPTEADSLAAKAKFEWTGRKETIAGHECEYATISGQDGTKADVCLAKDLGSLVPMGGGPGRRGGGPEAGLGARFAHLIGNTFPLKVVEDGKLQMQVTKIEKKSLDSSLFKVPDGYQKMGMPGGGFGGRGGF